MIIIASEIMASVVMESQNIANDFIAYMVESK